MKLEDFDVKPIQLGTDLLTSEHPLTIKDVLCHLLYLTTKANCTSRNWAISEMYRNVAIDLLVKHGVTSASEIRRLSPNLAT